MTEKTNNDSIVFGIDLGTTNSCIAYFDKDAKKPLVLNNLVSMPTTPSVVYIPDEQSKPVVGLNAVNRLGSKDAKNVVKCSKRLIAQDEKWSPDGDFLESGYPVYKGKPLSPITAASLIINELVYKNPNVMNLLGGKKPRVVVTFPAHFTPAAKMRTKQAVEIAGVEVLGMIEEPIAAALAYHVGVDCRNKTILTYDFGGGTFDCTVIEYDGSGYGTVKAKKGDPVLGGADCDNAFAFFLWEKYTAQTTPKVPLCEKDFKESQIEDLALLRTVDYFRKKAQEAKHGLTNQETVDVDLYEGDVVFSVTRKEFDACISEQVDKTLDIVQATLDEAKVEASAIDEVLLVGGSSIMPCVKNTLEQTYSAWIGKCKLTNPHEAVALGAAIWAEHLVNQPEITVIDNITNYSYGVRCITDDGKDYYVSNLILAGAKLPAVGKDIFSTHDEGSHYVAIRIYASELKKPWLSLDEATEIANPQDNRLMFERAVPKGTRLETTLKLDDAGILDVTSQALKVRGRCHFQLHVTGTLNAKKLGEAQKQIGAD